MVLFVCLIERMYVESLRILLGFKVNFSDKKFKAHQIKSIICHCSRSYCLKSNELTVFIILIL